jgi:hypothetical protein
MRYEWGIADASKTDDGNSENASSMVPSASQGERLAHIVIVNMSLLGSFQ